MRPKNDNIQKSYSVHIGSIRFILFSSVHSVLFSSFCPLKFYPVQFCIFNLIQFIQSTLALFGSRWSYSVHFGPIRSMLPTLVLFGPIQSILSILIHFSHIPSILSTLVLFSLFSPRRSYSVYIGPIRPLWSNCPLQSYLVHSFLFGPFNPTCSYSVLLLNFGLLQSIFVHLNNEKNMFGLKVHNLNLNLLKIYINLKVVISKILSISFIVTTFLLSHINLAF